MLLSRHRLDDGRRGAHEVRGQEIRGPHDLAPLVEAGKREQLLDDRRQVLRHRPHALEHVELAVRQRPDDLVGEQLLVAGERRQRRAQLVRHRREETALRAVGDLRLLEQIGVPQRERRVVGDDAQSVRVALGEHRRSHVARHRDDAENHLVRHQRREEHRADAHVRNDAQQRTRRPAEILDDDDVARPQHLARQRTRKREAPASRDAERADRRHELAFVRHRLENRRAASPALLGARVAEKLEQRGRVVFARHLPCETSQRFALARAFDVGQLDRHAVGVATHGELDTAFAQVAEDDASRDAVASRCDQRVE